MAEVWQVETLKTHFDDILALRDKANDVAFEAQQTALQTASTAADKALEQRANTLDREFHEHLEQVRHENALAFLNSDKAVQAALASAEKAVDKAEIANRAKFESVNEFREQLREQAATLMGRSETQALLLGISDRITRLEDRANTASGQDAGQAAAESVRQAGQRQTIAIIAVMATIVGVAVALILGLNT